MACLSSMASPIALQSIANGKEGTLTISPVQNFEDFVLRVQKQSPDLSRFGNSVPLHPHD